MKKYISIYHATREQGGSEEGGWYYWDRKKFRDIAVCFTSHTKVLNALARIQPILKRHPEFVDDYPHLSRLEARVYNGKHGPEEDSEQSCYS